MLKPTSSSEAKEPHRDSATIAALKCAYQLMQQRIISDPSSMMGILLFGTEKSKFEAGDDKKLSTQYPHCYLLSDLDKPSAQDVKRIRTLIEDENESKKLLVPSQEPVAMSNMLFCANQIFTTKAPNFSSRRLFLVTDGDDPHAGNKELKSAAVVRAKDLYDLGVTIELFPISTPYHDFETARFYDVSHLPSSCTHVTDISRTLYIGHLPTQRRQLRSQRPQVRRPPVTASRYWHLFSQPSTRK